MNEYFDEYKNVLKKFADFEGRATVREYWSFYLINSAVGLLLGLIVPVLALLLFFGALLPSIAVGVRRLHDQNRSGLYWFIAFIPFGVLVLLFWATQPGTGSSNDYGPEPLGPEGELPMSDSRNTGSPEEQPTEPAGPTNPPSGNPTLGTPNRLSSADPNLLVAIAVIGVVVGVAGIIYGLSNGDSSDEREAAPAATTAAPAATWTRGFSSAETETLNNYCMESSSRRWDCTGFVSDLGSLHTDVLAAQCPYNDVKEWIKGERFGESTYREMKFMSRVCGVCPYPEVQRAMTERWFDDPEWPIILEQNCGI